jgi:hypothetical protein
MTTPEAAKSVGPLPEAVALRAVPVCTCRPGAATLSPLKGAPPEARQSRFRGGPEQCTSAP